MLPAGISIATIFADATSVVTEFDTLIVIVVGMSFGIWGVKFLIGKLKGARS